MKLSALAVGVVVLAGAGSGASGQVRLRLNGACRVVEVVDGSGRPIAGAVVSYPACDPKTGDCVRDFISARVWTTDRTGRVCAEEFLDMHEGASLEVTAPERLGGGCAGLKYARARGTKPIVVRLRVSPVATAPLNGRITSADGRPVKGATVGVESINVSDHCAFFADGLEVQSSADGRFAFARVGKGTAHLDVKHPDFTPRSLSAKVPSSDNEIVLDEGATWQGRVFDPDGAPLTDCRVVATAPAGVVAMSPCTEGKFSLRVLPPGDIEIAVGGDEQSRLGARGWRTKTRIVQGEHRQQDLSWPKGVTLTGIIVDDSGAPIAEARLSALPRGVTEPPSASAPTEVTVRADGTGRFTFRHLVPGPWVIRGDRRAVLKGKLGEIEIDATTNRDGLRIISPRPTGN